MGCALKLIQVANRAADAAAVVCALESAGYEVVAETISGLDGLLLALGSRNDAMVILHQAALTDHKAVLDLLRHQSARTPCLILVEVIDQRTIDYMKAGARDCIARSELNRVSGAVKEAERRPELTNDHQDALRSLRESEEKFARAFQISPECATISRLDDGVYLNVNDGFTRVIGYTRDEVLNRSSLSPGISVWVNARDREQMVAELRAKGELSNFNAQFRAKDGRIIMGLLSARIIQINGVDCALCYIRDVTHQRESDHARLATIRLLYLCNHATDIKRLAHEVTLFFKELVGCDAVGLRLRDGADFPYFETAGFSNEFVNAESRLCTCLADGPMPVDAAGNPLLECMCGNVLQGRFDPNKPFFTRRGSFWTNSTSALLATTTAADRQARTRNRCHGEGYESVALVPLRSGHGTHGLIQLNDRRKNWFSARTIELIEVLAAYATVAIEKLQSRAALASSEEHLRQVLENAEAGYFFIDTSGRYRKVNSTWLKLHGYDDATEVIGQHFSFTQTEEDRVAAQIVVDQLLAGRRVPPGEFSRKRKDGTIGYHSFSAHVVMNGARTEGFEGFIIDTTGMRTMREQYQMLFEQMLDGFALHEMIFDEAGQPVDYRFLAINPAFEQITGLSASKVVGHRVREVLPGLDFKWIKNYGEVARTGLPRRFEDFSAELNKHFEVVAFRPNEGQFACLVRDVSARKQLELQLLHSQKMDAVGQLAGGVAHDFNNFLAAIMMHLNLLQRTAGMGAEIKNSLKELETEAKRAASLTRQLLMFSRRQVVQLCPTDLNDLLSNLLKMLRRLLGEHIQFNIDQDKGPLWINADPGMIEQVILNLCVNARDAMPGGGTLKIDTRAVNLSTTELLGDTEKRSGDFVSLCITDNGTGMSGETLAHIFEPFFTTKEPGKGTGLGLATVYSIVKQHSGWISVSSVPRRGTTFRVYFPAAPRSFGQTKESPSPQAAISGGSEGVLVVEDDAGFRTMVAMSLKVLGYQVFEASDGKHALELWEKHAHEIGLLFTDMVMPEGISGLDLCLHLKKARPLLRMIVTTGYLNDRLKPEQLAAEGILFLAKPFTAESLATTVRQCFDSPSLTT